MSKRSKTGLRKESNRESLPHSVKKEGVNWLCLFEVGSFRVGTNLCTLTIRNVLHVSSGFRTTRELVKV